MAKRSKTFNPLQPHVRSCKRRDVGIKLRAKHATALPAGGLERQTWVMDCIRQHHWWCTYIQPAIPIQPSGLLTIIDLESYGRASVASGDVRAACPSNSVAESNPQPPQYSCYFYIIIQFFILEYNY